MKKLLLTTSLVLCTSFAAYAETTAGDAGEMATDGSMMPSYMAGDMTISADTLIGKRVYIGRESAAVIDDRTMADGVAAASDDWDDAGEVGDVLVSSDGAVNSMIVDVGGFLGIGEREVRVSMDDVTFLRDNDDEGEYFVVYTGDRTALEGADDYDMTANESEGVLPYGHGGMSDQAAANAEETVNPEVGPGDVTETAMAEDETMIRPDRDAMEIYDTAALTADGLTGAVVYGANDNWVGEVGELVLAEDGTISHVVIDVGGWLGIGERPVALSFDQVDIRSGQGMAGLVVYVDATETELEAMPEWQG